MTAEHKQSGYAKFYSQKIKEFPQQEFGITSKKISTLWHNLSEDEKSTYKKDVSSKRKDQLKKTAAQQAQNLLVEGVKQEPEMMPIHKEEIN